MRSPAKGVGVTASKVRILPYPPMNKEHEHDWELVTLTADKDENDMYIFVGGRIQSSRIRECRGCSIIKHDKFLEPKFSWGDWLNERRKLLAGMEVGQARQEAPKASVRDEGGRSGLTDSGSAGS